VEPTAARVYIRGQGDARIEWDGLSWARPVKNGRPGANPKKAADVLAPGDVVHVVSDRRGNALLAQVPEAQGALAALDPEDGAVVAMVGGFDFYANGFNRATQARRQPGSGFKPFLYSAALDNGLTPASLILDAPIVVDDPSIEGAWRPENDSGEFGGPMPLREALVRSRNLVSIRILRTIGLDAVLTHAARFGFDPASMPHNETIALGTLAATPLQMAAGFATFANGGYKVEPYLVDRIENGAGETLFAATPLVVCRTCEEAAAVPPSTPDPAEGVSAVEPFDPAYELSPLNPTAIEAAARQQAQLEKRAAGAPPALAALAATQGGRGFLRADQVAPRVISAGNAWLMTDIMGDVIRRGTGQRARALNRNDLSGKTGTSQESRDAWFNGFNSRLVTTTWVGFDEERSLGDREEGSRTAVPIWVHFMREALRAMPEQARPAPADIVRLRVSPRTGKLADPLDPDAVTEAFLIGNQPTGPAPGSPGSSGPAVGGPGDPLF
jgi:penicillin-binding protein 1A